MAMDAGDNTIGAGTMARAIYDNLESEFGTPDEADSRDAWERMAAAVANAVVDHITNNAELRVTISTSDGGLQRDPATSTDTLAPSSDQNIGGTIS